jgi:hypothetical protein
MLTEKEVLNQSRMAMKQWESTWREHSRLNGDIYKKNMTSHKELLGVGVGKKMLIIGNGPSFENKIEDIKKYKTDDLDIMTIDKCFGSALNNNIKVNYVMIADAGISYEKYCEPWIDKTNDIILICNVNANPKWAANWKGKIYFYVNKDNIKSEEIFMPISGCHETIPAASNVGNAAVVFATQIFGYDEYLLIGYDYGWRDQDNYYAFEDSIKRNWMKHNFIIDNLGNFIYSSQNLVFSAKWLNDFFQMVCKQRGIKIFNLSGIGISKIPISTFDKRLKEYKKREISQPEKENILKSKIESKIFTKENMMELNSFFNNKAIQQVIVNYIPSEVINQWAI